MAIHSTGTALSISQVNIDLTWTTTLADTQWQTITSIGAGVWDVYTSVNLNNPSLTNKYIRFKADGSTWPTTDLWVVSNTYRLRFTADATWTPPGNITAGVGTYSSSTAQRSLASSSIRALFGRPSGPISFSDGYGKSQYWLAATTTGTASYNYDVAVDSQGSAYVVGNSVNYPSYYGFVYKISGGQIIWAQRLTETHSSTHFVYVTGCALDSTGNYLYVAGLHNSNPSGFSVKAYAAKLDAASGSLIWARSYTQSIGTEVKCSIDSSDNFYLVSAAVGLDSTQDNLIIKINSSGQPQLTVSQGSSSPASTDGFADQAYADSAGNIYLASGYSLGGGPKALVSKINSSGTLQWARYIYPSGGGFGSELGYGITADSAGNIYASLRMNDAYCGIVKFDSSGTLQWQREIRSGVDTGSILSQIFPSEDKNYFYIAGNTYNSSSGITYGILVKINTSGSIVWSRRFTNGNYVEMRSVRELGGYLYVAGNYGVSGGSNYALSLKLPIDGSLRGTYGSITYETDTATSSVSSYVVETATGWAATVLSGTTTTNYLSAGTESPAATSSWTAIS